MCRWLAYTGSPVLLTNVLYTPVHSLIDQSLHSKLGAETTNGDGFGIGWYDAAPAPGVFRSIEPAWNDQNLRELAGHISSHLFFAHIRAAIGSAVQQTNCHPFRHGRWLFMHNGFIDGFAAIKRDLVLAVDESLFPEIKGQADTEVLFYLALTFGLADDPPDAVARAIGFVEACGRQRGITDPFQGTIATSDGESLWVFRYSSAGRSRSLFFSRDARTVKRQYPERPALQQLSDDARFVVSEPIGDLPGAWAELPEASYGVVSTGGDQLLPFTPKPPSKARLWPGNPSATQPRPRAILTSQPLPPPTAAPISRPSASSATAAPGPVLAACSAVAAPAIATSTNGVAISSVSPFSTLISRRILGRDRPVDHHARAEGRHRSARAPRRWPAAALCQQPQAQPQVGPQWMQPNPIREASENSTRTKVASARIFTTSLLGVRRCITWPPGDIPRRPRSSPLWSSSVSSCPPMGPRGSPGGDGHRSRSR